LQRSIITVIGIALMIAIAAPAVQADVGIGADLVSRYVWRGTDFGNSAAIQPSISYTSGSVEIGAWSSWSLTGDTRSNQEGTTRSSIRTVRAEGDTISGSSTGRILLQGRGDDTYNGSENDLYVTYSNGPISVTITDYFFPGNDFFSFSADDEIHTIELSAAYSSGKIGIMAAYNVSGGENAFYAEGSYELMSNDDASAGISVGLGNEVYTSDGDPTVVAVGINVAKGDYTASYILNPDQETTFLVVGRSF